MNGWIGGFGRETGFEPLEIQEQQSGFETHSESPELSRESVARDLCHALVMAIIIGMVASPAHD